MNKTINTSKRYIFSVIVVAVVASLSSCNSSLNSGSTDSTTANITPSPIQSAARLNPQLRNESPASQQSSTDDGNADKTVNVTIYISDIQCQELIPQTVAVPAQEPVTAAVGKILEQRDSADFSFSAYRVNLENGIATVDLRITPNSQRRISSLSSCEQFALFGSLRKTLTSNPEWGIKNVRFTEKGKEIIL
ncbi:MAG: GerMN domain-containing protein [Fischerella sp.]|nr:GerMN domain-containing protein [Fischerella sp.]